MALNFTASRCIHVRRLNIITGGAQLKEYFEKFGKVSRTFVFMDKQRLTSRGSALVMFEKEDSVIPAIAAPDHMIDGINVVVKRHEEKASRTS